LTQNIFKPFFLRKTTMFLLMLNALTLRTVIGDNLCLDLEAGDFDWLEIRDDELGEESHDTVCAYQDGDYRNRVCRSVIRGLPEDGACFGFENQTLDEDKDFYIVTQGHDAVWIDRFIASRQTIVGIGSEWEKKWGRNNNDGWCLSMDRNDWLDWNYDGRPQHVPDNECYFALQLKADGSVYGYRTSQPRKCRESKMMNCKQGCDSGWTHYETVEYGCCSSFFSCGGNRKLCSKDVECRRRSEADAEDPEVTVEVLPPLLDEEHGHWVLLSTPEQDPAARVEGHADHLAARLSTASAVKDDVKSAIAALERLLADIGSETGN